MEVNDPLDSSLTLRLAEAQYAAASAIYGSSEAAEILSAVVVFGGKTYEGAELALIEPDVDPPQLRVVAQRAGSAIVAANELRPLDSYPAYDALGAVEYLYAPDIDIDPFLTETEREPLRAKQIGSLLIVPLVVGQTLIGLIQFNNPTPVETSVPVLRALRNLSDQIAVVFENRALLRRTETSLNETQTLYDLNRALLAAQDPLELLRALANHIGSDADSIMHILVNHRRDGSDELSVQHIITKKGEQVVNIPIKGMRAQSLLTGTPTEVTFIEDIQVAPADAPLLDLLKERTRSYAAIIARSADRTADIVTIAYEQPRAFDTRTRRLYSASADQLNIVLQNQRLLFESQSNAERLSRQVRVLQLLNRVATGISSFQTEKMLLDNVVSEMQQGMGVDHIGVVLIQRDGRTGVLTSEAPDTKSIGVNFDMRENPMIASLLDDPSKPVVVQDVETDPMVNPDVRAALRGINVTGIMILPLYVYGRFIGTIGFDMYERGRTFSADVIELAQTMTTQLAIGLQNIRLFSEAQQRAEQMQRVAALGQALQATLETEPVLRVMLNSGTNIIPTEQLSIALYDDVSGLLRLVGRYEDGDAEIDLAEGPLLSLDTHAGQVWSSGTMMSLGDTVQPNTKDGRTSSVMIAPIRTRDHRIGTVSVSTSGLNIYSEPDKAMFQQMVNLLAVALENSAAYARSQRVARSEALVNEVTARFQQFSDVEGLVNTAVSELGKALGAKRARVRLTDPETIGRDAGREQPR